MSEGATATAAAATSNPGGEAAASEAASVKSAETTDGATAEATDKAGETEKAVEAKDIKTERKLIAYLKNHNKDHDFGDGSDNDAIDGMAVDRFTKLDKYQSDMQTANDSLVKIFRSDPTLTKVIKNMISGASFQEALARNMDLDTLKKVEGDPDHDKWAKAKEDRLTDLKSRDEHNETIDANRQQSMKDMGEFFTENKISDEEAGKFAESIDRVLQDVFDGKISKEFLSMMRKAMEFDTAVGNAAAQGEIKAKNEKIETMKVDAEKEKGDGVPVLDSKNTEKESDKAPVLGPVEKSLKQHLERGKNLEVLLGPGNTD